MQNLLPLEAFFWYASLFLKIVLLWRLFALRLAPRYKALCVSLALASVRSILLMSLEFRSNLYGVVYFVTQPLIGLAYVAVVLEIYGQIFEAYRGISFLGRGFLLTAFITSAAVSIWLHVAEFNVNGGPFAFLRYYLTGESSLYVVMLMVLLALAIFLFWYPVPLRKNLVHYNLIFLVFFGAMSAGLYMGNPDPSSVMARLGSAMRMGVDTACLSLWIALFRREWETESAGVAFALSSAHQAQVLHQLDSMNQAILRVRKSQ